MKHLPVDGQQDNHKLKPHLSQALMPGVDGRNGRVGPCVAVVLLNAQRRADRQTGSNPPERKVGRRGSFPALLPMPPSILPGQGSGPDGMVVDGRKAAHSVPRVLLPRNARPSSMLLPVAFRQRGTLFLLQKLSSGSMVPGLPAPTLEDAIVNGRTGAARRHTLVPTPGPMWWAGSRISGSPPDIGSMRPLRCPRDGPHHFPT